MSRDERRFSRHFTATVLKAICHPELVEGSDTLPDFSVGNKYGKRPDKSRELATWGWALRPCLNSEMTFVSSKNGTAVNQGQFCAILPSSGKHRRLHRNPERY